MTDDDMVVFETGIDPAGLADDDLFRELASLHRTRLDTLRHGPDAALANHLGAPPSWRPNIWPGTPAARSTRPGSPRTSEGTR